MLARKTAEEGVLLTTYVHNYEFDPRRLVLSEVLGPDEAPKSALRTELSANLFRSRLRGRLSSILSQFHFGTCRDYLKHQGVLDIT